ncbi:MAG: chemotaxis protein CheD [Planctomycetia bacterium]|nr:chemotaxis protein CheD [Planctomycetia bacterium]
MTVAEATKTSATPFVGMGQLLTAQPPVRLASVLGSCVAVCLYHPRLRVAGMAHVVLPESTGHQGGPGKFADTAVPALLAALEKLTGLKAGYQAKLAGGASMFAASGPLQIGIANAAAVKAALAKAHVRVVSEHLGGSQGRRVEFDPATGALSIEVQGQPAVVL